MQLGVVHALLTIQGKAPHAVAGVSAGAVNAVALADILQAGNFLGADEDCDPGSLSLDDLRERQRARISRFRQVFEAELNAPGDLKRAFVPDMLQVGARQSLQPLELPIHFQEERDARSQEFRARQGFIDLANDLIGAHFSITTLTRFMRAALGWRAAGDLRRRTARYFGYAFESLRVWILVGFNLGHIAALLPLALAPIFASPRADKGDGTTAAIIFRLGWARTLRRAAATAISFVALLLIWLAATVTLFGVLWVKLIAYLATKLLPDPGALVVGLIAYAVPLGVAVALMAASGAWREVVEFNHTKTFRVVRQIASGFAALIGQTLVWLAIPATIITAIVLWSGRAGTVSGWCGDWWPACATATALWRGYLGVLLAVAGVGVLLLARAALIKLGVISRRSGRFAQRLLARYDLADGLLSAHPLRRIFIQLFDPDYYGRLYMDDVVDRGLRDDFSPAEVERRPKLLSDFEAPGSCPPIAVGVIAANIGDGNLEIVPAHARVVDALTAATAVTPFFPPLCVDGRMYVDGANLTTEPTEGALDLLRSRVNAKASVVHLYTVSPLPFSSPTLPDDRPEIQNDGYLTLVDVTMRALRLQRFRDAALERRLTELYTQTMPAGQAKVDVAGGSFLRVWVTPVEPEKPIELNQRLAAADCESTARDMISETVADGCRAAMEVMIRASSGIAPNASTIIPCRTAVNNYLARPGLNRQLPLLVDTDEAMPGSSPPGLPEVCKHCRVGRGDRCTSNVHRASLNFTQWKTVGPVWPHQSEVEHPDPLDPHFQRHPPEFKADNLKALQGLRASYQDPPDSPDLHRWPKGGRDGTASPANDPAPYTNRPLVSFLFSGGVFRGVYQLGTLNALSEAGMSPDLIAGASVGAITSAMIAQAFASPAGVERRTTIARLAATYLAIDRLVLTDRFADFVRGVTLRAAASDFSLSQADLVFRRYDEGTADRYDRTLRRVVAGIERLTYLSPFELKDLVKALRLRQVHRVFALLRSHAQEFLDRMGVGHEVLGAEPLALLIAEHVLQRLSGETWSDPEMIPFDRYLRSSGIYFLATTTNLTAGRLHVLGEQQVRGPSAQATLLEGLLASSAFPGVFRPRWSWEVTPETNARHQYVDGGLMDNLPLDVVAEFLNEAAEARLLARRATLADGSEVPHLLLSASLEVDLDPPTHDELDEYPTYWPAVKARAAQLRYNKKLELYQKTQRDLRAIFRSQSQPGTFTPLDLEVVMVRPRWLCGTFGFHPMLGFRRERQAASIAHGCATTLLELARVARDPVTGRWAGAWGINLNVLPPEPEPPATARSQIVPAANGEGNCHFRPGIPCPFSAGQLQKTRIPDHTARELEEIYRACGRRETHQPKN